MEKTKNFINSKNKWQALERYILRIETYKDTDCGIVLESCKALLEAIFKTILVEAHNKTESELKNFSIGNLYNEIKDLLSLKDKKYANVIGSFTNCITEFRNKHGETSHGKDIYTLENNRELLFELEIDFILQNTDNIAVFVLNYYENLYPALKSKQKNIQYTDFADFNDYFDGQYSQIKIGEYEFSASEILFNLDPIAYKTEFENFKQSNIYE